MTYAEIKKELSELDTDQLSEALSVMAFAEFEPYEAARSLKCDISAAENEETFNMLNRFFIGLFGWSIETLIIRAKGYAREESEEEVA